MKQILFSLCLIDDTILLSFERFVEDKKVIKYIAKILNNVFPKMTIKFIKPSMMSVYKNDKLLRKYVKDGVFIYNEDSNVIKPIKFIIDAKIINNEHLKDIEV